MTDPITDMLNRIRNAQAVAKETVSLPYSNIKYEVAKVIEANGFVGKVEKKGRKEKKFIDITLKYESNLEDRQNMTPAITEIKRISKPGKRIYMGAKELKGGRGISVVSTPRGVMTAMEAKKKKLGGEVICELW